MRILFLVTQDLDSPSCLGRFFPLARHLASQGHAVRLAALHADISPALATRFTRDNVEVHYVGQMHVRKRGDTKTYFSAAGLILNALKATLALTRVALGSNADLLYICKPHPMNSLAALAARMLRRKAVFLDYDDFEAGSGRFQGAWQRAVVAFFEDRVPRWVDHVTTHTTFLQDRLRALGIPAQKITFLPTGVDEVRFKEVVPDQVEKLRESLGLEGRQVVAFIGSLSLPSHPVELLLQAFDIVHTNLPESCLMLVGGGEQFEALRDQASLPEWIGSILLAGRIPPGEIPAYYRLADLVVDPVYDDMAARGRLPLKLLESWVSGVPFISAQVGDRQLLLGDPPAGLLAIPGDASDLARCILNVLTDPALAEDLRRRGIERARLYSWTNLTGELSSVLAKYSPRVRL